MTRINRRLEVQTKPMLLQRTRTPPPPPSRSVDVFQSVKAPVVPAGLMTPTPPAEAFSRAEKQAAKYPPSLPDEGLAQYAMRTAAATGFQTSHLGAMLSMVSQSGAAPGASFAEIIDRHQNPTAYWSDAEISRQNMMRARDLEAANKVFTGPVPVGSLTSDDKFYLYKIASETQVRDIHYQVLSGPQVDIARAINWVGSDRPASVGTFDMKSYHGQLRVHVERILAEYKAAHGG